MQAPCHVSHVALRLGNIPYHTKFFETVFGMTVIRVDGPAENPRSVWLDGGIQLMRDTSDAPLTGAMDHLCIIVPDVAEALRLAAPFGATPVAGKGAHWFTIPGGPNFELKLS